MNETLADFTAKIKEPGHVRRLLDHKEFGLILICGKQRAAILFKAGQAFLTDDAGIDIDQYVLQGDQISFAKLLTGRETLRALMEKQELSISAPFRILLLLESLFYLIRLDEKLNLTKTID